MAAYLPAFFYQQFFYNGAVAAGQVVYVYETGTSTPKTVYTDQGGTIPYAQPIVLDANGRPEDGPFWILAGECTIKQYTAPLPGGALVDTFNDVGGTADAGLREDLADSDGSDLVGYGSGTVYDRLQHEVWANDYGASNNATTLNAALASGASAVHVDGAWAIGATDVTIPAGVSLIGEPGTSITSSGGDVIIIGSPTAKTLIENIKFDMGATGAQVYGEGADNVTTRRCDFTNSTNNGMLMSLGPRYFLSDDCRYYDNGKAGLYVAGTTTDAPFDIEIRSPKAHGNGEGGVVVAGVGEQTSPAQTANYADVIRISNALCYDNGTSANSGIEVFYATNATISEPICYDNFEHGISLQEVDGFVVTGGICKENGSGGFCGQSGYDPYRETKNGTLTGTVLIGNDVGIYFKEQCADIVVSGVIAQDNTSHSARLVDIGGSGLKSTDIVFIGGSFVPSGGNTITNSNGSTNVTSSAGLNHFGTTAQVNQMVGEAISTAVTIDTKGTTQNFPEVFVITNTGADVSRSAVGEASLYRRITLMADAAGSVVVRHNQGGGSFAGFVLSAAATVTLGAWESITFMGNGTDWIEIGKNT